MDRARRGSGSMPAGVARRRNSYR